VVIDPTGIANAGSAALFTAGIAPGELITIYGAQGANFVSKSMSDFNLPTTLGGIQVTINNRPAPIYSLDTTYQDVTVMVPYETTELIASIQLIKDKVPSNTVTLFTSLTAPGVLTQTANGIGYAEARRGTDSSLITPSNPAHVGEHIFFEMVGGGAVNPPVADGAFGPSNPASNTTNTFAVFIDGIAATVEFSGLAPTQIGGAYQINVVVPTGVRSGDRYMEIAGPDSDNFQAVLSISP
jgi:uncharacterized protein (TIGR03437 family)